MRSDTVGRPMEIVLVEDSLTEARLTMGVLRGAGILHRMTWLNDGADAMQFLKQHGKYAQAPRPDLVLLDLTLPGKDGREILTELRSDESLANIPVVVLTASTSEEDKSRSDDLEVESYLTKPIEIERFLSVIRQLNRFWHEDMIVPSDRRAAAGETDATEPKSASSDDLLPPESPPSSDEPG